MHSLRTWQESPGNSPGHPISQGKMQRHAGPYVCRYFIASVPHSPFSVVDTSTPPPPPPFPPSLAQLHAGWGKLGMVGMTFRPGNGVKGHCCGLWNYAPKKEITAERFEEVMKVKQLRNSVITYLSQLVDYICILPQPLWIFSFAALPPFGSMIDQAFLLSHSPPQSK